MPARRPRFPLLPSFALVAALAAGAAFAQGFTDKALARLADDAYLKKVTFDAGTYREVARTATGGGSGVQALAVERKSDLKVVVGYAGTSPSDSKDVLADIGIGAQEADAVMRATIASLAEDFEKQGWVAKGGGAAIRKAMEAEYGLKLVTAAATKAGKPHGPGCGSGFFDIKGECWECPSGYKHDNILLPPDNPKVCKDDGGRDNKKGKEVGTSIAGICKEGWVSLNNGKCYQCPSGYKHDISKSGTTSGVCYKDLPDKYAKANKKGGNLLCDKGFFDPIDGGTCWTCPSGYVRGVTPVKAKDACLAVAPVKEAKLVFDAGLKVDARLEGQLAAARAFLDKVLSSKDAKGGPITIDRVVIVGHSLGGYLAQVVAAERKAAAVTFNAPGAANYNRSLASGSIRNLHRRDDPVGNMGRHVGSDTVLPNVRFDFVKDAGGAKYLVRNHSITELAAQLN